MMAHKQRNAWLRRAPAYWFLRAEEALEHEDSVALKDAIKQLRRLGVVVRYESGWRRRDMVAKRQAGARGVAT